MLTQAFRNSPKAARKQVDAAANPRFVAYFRVSTGKQGASGLGLDAQRWAVHRHVAGAGGVIIAEFQEIESGSRNDRPQLDAAISACRLRHATLVIAQLDRLGRNVAFISSLMEAGVDFVACDNPHATRLTIHLLAAVAEHEREMISQATKAALAAAKARGTRLGNPNLKPGDSQAALIARNARSATARAYAIEVFRYIQEARKAGCISLRDIAQALTARGIRTPLGSTTWTPTQVKRVMARATRRGEVPKPTTST